MRALARESAQADVEAARKEASARIRDAQVAADEVLEQAKAVSGGHEAARAPADDPRRAHPARRDELAPRDVGGPARGVARTSRW